MSDERLIDENALRASLRLEADERPPRLDVMALRAASRGEAPLSPAVMLLGSLAIAILSLAAVVTALRIAAGAAALLTGGDIVVAVIGVSAALAQPLELILAIVTQPAVPIAILACLIVGFYYERLRAEGEGHVRAS